MRSKEGGRRMKKNNKGLRITAFIIALALIAIILFFANAFVGNPISAMMAKIKAEQYVEQNFSFLDLELEKPVYNFKFGEYIVKARSKTSRDTHFNIYYRGGKIVGDEYDINVEQKYNTLQRLEEEYTFLVRNVIEELGYKDLGTRVFYSKQTEEAQEYLKLDMDFDKNLPIETEIYIQVQLKELTVEEIARILKDVYTAFEQKGYHFEKYSINYFDEECSLSVSNVTPDIITGGELEEILTEAKEKGHHGEVSFYIRQ